MHDIPNFLILRLPAKAIRVQQHTLDTRMINEPATHQARELLCLVVVLLEEMTDPEQLQPLELEKRRLRKAVG